VIDGDTIRTPGQNVRISQGTVWGSSAGKKCQEVVELLVSAVGLEPTTT
jgi:hypothetical protein